MKRLITLTLASGLLVGTAAAQTSPNQQDQSQDQTQNPSTGKQPTQVLTRPVQVAPQIAPLRPAKVVAPKATKVITSPVPVRRTVVPVPVKRPSLAVPLHHQNNLLRHYSEPDFDGDGQNSVPHGGGDCDDGNPNRFSSNAEVADFNGNDEDCDPTSIGEMDRDGDGFTDYRVFNAPWTPGGRPIYGDDCDDTRRGVNPGVPEIPGNGLDDNCDGDIDFDDSWPTRPSE